MTRQVVVDVQAGFAGGLNSVSDPAFMGPDQARQLANFRLTSFGAALKRLGTQLVQTSAITTFDSTGSVYSGLYWPDQNTIYLWGGGTSSTDVHLYSTTYGSFPRTWTDIGACPQYRPVVFTDNVSSQVLYIAGDNGKPIYKASPAYETLAVSTTSRNLNVGPATTVDSTHQFSSGANRLLVVLVTAKVAISAVAYDPAGTNTALTRFATFTANGRTVDAWYLIAPPDLSGAFKTVRATVASTTTQIDIACISLTGTHQTSPFSMSSPRTASGAIGTQPEVVMRSNAREIVIDAARSVSDADSFTPGAGQTGFFFALGAGMGASYETGADTVSMDWTGVSDAWVQMALAVQPAVSSPSLTITALSGEVPGVTGLCVYNDRLWGWNADKHPNSIFYSNLSTTSGSNGGDSLGVAPDGGEIVVRTFGLVPIRACAAVNKSLVIWHEAGISILTGWGADDLTVEPQALSSNVGMANATPDGMCVANELLPGVATTLSTGDTAYFVTLAGIYKTNGYAVTALATPEKPDPTAALLANGTVNPSQFILRYNRQFNELWVGITGVGIYIYNVILQAWSGPFTGTYASGLKALFEVVDTTGARRLWRATYSGSAGTGLIVSECDRASVYKDDVVAAGTGGTTVTGTLQLRRMFGKDALDRMYSKAWRWVNVLATLTSGGNAPVMSSMTTLGGTKTHTFSGLTSLEQPYYISPGGTGPYLDVTITDTNATGASQYAMASVMGNFLGQR